MSVFSIDGMDAKKIDQEPKQTRRVHVKYRQVRRAAGLRVSPHLYMLKSDLDVLSMR